MPPASTSSLRTPPPDATLAAAFHRQAINRPNDPALWDGDTRQYLSWGRLYAWASTLAGQLQRQLADEPKTTPAVCHGVQNSVDDLLVVLACRLAGVVEVPIDAMGGQAYVEACRQRSGAIWLSGSNKREWVERSRSESALMGTMDAGAGVRVNDPSSSESRDALVLWTSGTSGRPKGVVLSEHALVSNAWAKLLAVPQRSDDVRLTVLSIAHAYARTCDLGTWLLSGCRLAIAQGFDGWMRWAFDLQPTLCNTVPSLAERMLGEDAVPAPLRLLGCGGAALSTDAFGLWRERGVTVIQGYGLTEAGPVIASQTPSDSIAGHAGRFVDGWEHRIRDARLWVRGPHRMIRYLDDPQATMDRIDREGWLDTGDLVELSERSGQLRILGRADDRIVLANGYVVDPLAIELRLMRLPQIAMAVALRSTDGRGIEWWLEPRDADAGLPPLADVIDSLPNWEKPRAVNSFRIPADRRDQVINRKGAVRRKAMCRLLGR